jgi:hypothetical protein
VRPLAVIGARLCFVPRVAGGVRSAIVIPGDKEFLRDRYEHHTVAILEADARNA